MRWSLRSRPTPEAATRPVLFDRAALRQNAAMSGRSLIRPKRTLRLHARRRSISRHRPRSQNLNRRVDVDASSCRRRIVLAAGTPDNAINNTENSIPCVSN